MQHAKDQINDLRRIVHNKDQNIDILANKLLIKDQERVKSKPRSHLSPQYISTGAYNTLTKESKFNCNHASRSTLPEVRLTDENYNTQNSKNQMDKGMWKF